MKTDNENTSDQNIEAPAPSAAGNQTPRRMRRAAEIIAAARQTFLEKGFERASVSEIAAKVGVVEGLLYSYYPTKRDLLNEVLRGMYEPLIREMEDGFSRLQGLRSRMRFLEYFNSALHDLHVRYTAFLIRTVRDAVAHGELPADTDSEMVRGIVYGGIEHRMWGVLFGRDTVNVEVAADRFTDMVLCGILPNGHTGDSPTAAPHASSREDIERRLDRLEKIVAAGSLQPTAPRRKKTS